MGTFATMCHTDFPFHEGVPHTLAATASRKRKKGTIATFGAIPISFYMAGVSNTSDAITPRRKKMGAVGALGVIPNSSAYERFSLSGDMSTFFILRGIGMA